MQRMKWSYFLLALALAGIPSSRAGIPTNIQGLEKLTYVVDEFSSADDFSKNYELFQKIFVKR